MALIHVARNLHERFSIFMSNLKMNLIVRMKP